MSSERILVKNERDPLAGLSRQEFEAKLRSTLTGRVQEAWFFGSYAAGDFGPDSDIDLMLVEETDAPFQTRAFAFEDLLDLGPRIDILVYTPDEFARLTADPSPGFWRNATKAMRRLL